MLGPGVGEGTETAPVSIVEVGSVVGVDSVGTFAVIVAGDLLVGSTGTTSALLVGVDIGVVEGAKGVSASSWPQPVKINSALSSSKAFKGGNKSLKALVSRIMSPSSI